MTLLRRTVTFVFQAMVFMIMSCKEKMQINVSIFREACASLLFMIYLPPFMEVATEYHKNG